MSDCISNSSALFILRFFFKCISALLSTEKEVVIEDSFQIGKCSKCGKVFFCTNYGSFACTACEFSNGDHDITTTNIGSIVSCNPDFLLELFKINTREVKSQFNFNGFSD